MADRYDKFTERARRAITLSQEEALRFNHNYIGTEHQLLGLVREGEGVAVKVLANFGVEPDKVRSAVESVIDRGDRAVMDEIGLTPRAKKAIELAVDEARRLSHHYIGTEHLLLGLVREGEGIAAGVLESLGVTLDKLRAEVMRVLSPGAQTGIADKASATIAEQEVEEGVPGAPVSGEEPPVPYEPAALTPKIATDAWQTEDSLGHEAYARTIANLITHEETRPPLTIGIKGPWGSGKTSIMKMVQHILDGDADVTEQNRAEHHVSRPEAEISVGDLLDGLKKVSRLAKLQLNQGEKGKRYGIPARATVWFNAWKYQTSQQIWAGLAHCMISQVTARLPLIDRERFWLKLHASRVDENQVRHQVYRLVIGEFLPTAAVLAVLLPVVIGAAAVAAITGVMGDLASAGLGGAGMLGVALAGILRWFQTRSNKLSQRVSGSLRELVREPDYEGKMGFLHLVESDIRQVLDLVATPEQPLVIFVDDLDRCAPNKIAEVVEAINLFLSGDYPNCIFVLGMEPAVVAASLEVANKDLIDKIEEFSLVGEHAPLGWRFMEKIIQLPLAVPLPTSVGIETYVNALIGRANQNSAAITVPGPEEIQTYVSQLGAAQSVAGVVEATDQLLKESDVEKKAAIVEASKRAYSQKFVDRDPVIAEFVHSAVTLFQANPRQIKRYVNMFRYLSTLRHALSLDRTLQEGGRPEMPTDQSLAKLISLCIHWPQATDCFRKIFAPEGSDSHDGASVLAYLETTARSLAKGDNAEADTQWRSALQERGLNLGDWGESRAFRHFLARGEPLAQFEGCGLW